MIAAKAAALIVTVGPNRSAPLPSLRGRDHTHISEINLQPPHTKREMMRRTKTLAVNSSRPGYAVGGKSKPSSSLRSASTDRDPLSATDRDALSARKVRACKWATFVSRTSNPERSRCQEVPLARSKFRQTLVAEPFVTVPRSLLDNFCIKLPKRSDGN